MNEREYIYGDRLHGKANEKKKWSGETADAASKGPANNSGMCDDDDDQFRTIIYHRRIIPN